MRGEDLPRANEAEAALLGACLLSDDAVRVALDIVTVSDFYGLKHQQVFTAVLKARDTGLVDAVTVGEHYDGVQYLHELQNSAPSISGAGRYAEQVADAARRRRLILASSEIQKSAMQASSAEEAIDSSKAALDAIEYARTDVEMPKGVLDFQQQYIHQPYDWLIPNVLEREDRMMITGFEGMGKALRLDEPIPTPEGWTTMGDLQVGDRVLDRHGTPCHVTALSEINETPDARELIFSDGSTIQADVEHQWITIDYAARQNDHRAVVRTTTEIEASLAARKGHTANHAIPAAGALDLCYAHLPVSPYVLGVWLGDGHTADGRVTLGRRDADVIEQNMSAEGWEVRRQPSGEKPGSVNVGIRDLKPQLRDLGVLGCKHIPAQYLRASVEQRSALLAGLMDADGYIDESARCEITLTCQELANGTLELVRSLGILATMRESDAKLNGRVVGRRWRIGFRSPFNPFTVTWKAGRWRPARTRRASYRYIVDIRRAEPLPMRCIQVDSRDHTYLAGRSMIPTHNSTFVRQLAFQAACGVHPFSWEPIAPAQSLIVDCENHPRQVSREIDVLTRAHKIDEQELLRIESRRGGINLLSPADRRWLLNLVAISEAELLCIGPLYKMFRGSASKSDFGGEEQARQITEVLEDVRTRCGCAVILEAHAPKGSGPLGRDLAPRGSGVWMGWPEFGLGMRPEGDEADDYLLERWRGDRDAQRQIPKMVRRNASKWPWTPQFLNV